MSFATAQQELLKAIHYLSEGDRNAVEKALNQATEWHRGQFRESGDPYITHPIAIAIYLASYEAGKHTLIAALLHDVVEDDRATYKDVEKMFGETVAKIVNGVTKLTKLQYEGRRNERQLGSLRKMLLTANEDLRVILIKLADRWHNVTTIGSLKPDKQLRIARETLDIYVPFARLVGWWSLKRTFEEICFPLAYPKESQQWHDEITRVRKAVQKERESFVKRINSETKDEVVASLDLMTDYQVYSKLQGNIKRLDDAHSIDSVQIVLKKAKEELECYRVLGEIHSHYPAQSGSFRDYVNAPQPNGYRALHTTIFLAQNHRVRLRIQTEEMLEYASRRKLSEWAADRSNDVYKALGSLHAVSFDKEKYLTDLDQTVLKKRINVFTPTGEIITLPQGATGIDFAFTVNPDHMPYLAGIRVNGDLKEAAYVLNDGDTVALELVRNGGRQPKSMWIEKVKSIEVRENLKKSLKHRPKKERYEDGKRLFESECRKYKLPVGILFHLPSLQRHLAKEVKRPSFEIVLEQIGSGELSLSLVINEYKKILSSTPSLPLRVLQFFHLLPRSRVLNQGTHLIEIEVYALDRQGLIYEITKCFAERDINISLFKVYALPPQDALYTIRLEVKDFEDFSGLYDALLQVPTVKKVVRRR